VQGPFASAAKLLAAFQSGQLHICSLPAPYSGSPSAIGWASTILFKAPRPGANDTDASPAIANSGLQSQVQTWQGLLSSPCSRSRPSCSFTAIGRCVVASCRRLEVAVSETNTGS
jgi:hypothetical protein